MKQADVSEGPYRVPRETSPWRALALAAAVHAGLFFFLWVGIHWQSTEPVAAEAEVWDMKTQTAAPLAPPPPEAVDPTPAVVTPPAPPPPPPPVAAAEPVEAPPVEAPPDIALERRKAKLQKEKELAAERKRQDKLDQEKQEQQDKADRLAQAKEDKAKADKAQAKADAKAKALADAKAEAKAEKEQAELDKKLADKAAEKKLAGEKAAKAKRDAAEAKASDNARADNLKRMQDMLGSGGSGAAAKSTGARNDSGYVAAITAKIKSNIAYNGSDAAGNPRAIYKIEQLPTGEITSVRKIKSSGIAAYDSAVENAIAKSSPLPKKKDGTVVREVEAIFDMKDQP